MKRLLLLLLLTLPALATVPSTTVRVGYSGNGSTTTFSFPYYYENTTDLLVYLQQVATRTEYLQSPVVNYTVSAPSTAGGTVTFVTAPATGYNITIIRAPALTQGFTLLDNDPLPAGALVAQIDYMAMQIQRLNDQVGRCAQITDGNTEAFNPYIPTYWNLNPGYLIGINAAGNGLDVFAPSTGGMGPTTMTTFTGPTGTTIQGSNQGGAATTITQVNTGTGLSSSVTAGVWTANLNAASTGLTDVPGNSGTGNILRVNNGTVSGLTLNNCNVGSGAPLTITGGTSNGPLYLDTSALVRSATAGTTNQFYMGTTSAAPSFKTVAAGGSLAGNLPSPTFANASTNASGDWTFTPASGVRTQFGGTCVSIPDSAGAPTGATVGDFYNDTNQNAVTVNTAQAAAFKLEGCPVAPLTNTSTWSFASLAGIGGAAAIGTSCTIPANSIKVGKTIECEMYGFFSSSAGALPVFILDAGATTVAAQGGLAQGAPSSPLGSASVSVIPFQATFRVTFRAVGSGGFVMSTGQFLFQTTTAAPAFYGCQAPYNGTIAVSTAVSQTFQVLVYSVGSAGAPCNGSVLNQYWRILD